MINALMYVAKKCPPPTPEKKSNYKLAKVQKLVNYTHPANMSKKLSAIVKGSLVEA